MLLDFYNLREQPFGVTPDPRFLYLSATHREAMASILYGVQSSRGFTTLIAKPGMGKTTLLYCLLERLRSSARTAFIFQTQCNSHELLRYLAADLGVETNGQDIVETHQQLNQFLVREAEKGGRVVVIIDEAQNLSEEVLESVRLLTNFETPKAKLVQVILAGQPPLADRLASPALSQLLQRVSISARLMPFTRSEVDGYINHRLLIAGHTGKDLFDSEALSMIAEYSEGIPRKINNMCFNALSIGCALGKNVVGRAVLEEVIRDSDINLLRTEAPAAISSPPVEPEPLSVREDMMSGSRALEVGGAPAPAFIPRGQPRWSGGWLKWALAASALLFSALLFAALQGSNRSPSVLLKSAVGRIYSFAGGAVDLAKSFASETHGDVAQASTPPASNQTVPGREAPRRSQAVAVTPLKMPGRLEVRSSLEGARISLDGGKTFKWGAPHTFRLQPGTYRVEVTKAGYETKVQSVRVLANSVSSFFAALDPALDPTKGGTALIVTEPSRLEVLIDGKSVGMSPANVFLPVGKHTYKVVPPPEMSLAPVEGSFETEDGSVIIKTLKWSSGTSPQGAALSGEAVFPPKEGKP